MNSLTMLGQLEAFFAVSSKYRHMPVALRSVMEEADRLRESIEQFVLSSKWPVDAKEVQKELNISGSSARDHLATLTKQNRIKQLSTRPMTWTRREG
jgi:predicted ArsR family transcriptional regulator